MSFRPPTPGAIVDNKYRLAERIGGGGMGDVFRAELLLNGRAAAIKFLHPELAQNMEVAQRFFQEAQAVTKIRHPNVVEVIDAGTGDMGPYIVMEYLDGESVGSALNRVARFEIDAAIGTAMPVLEALDAAHRVGIVHRDLKPENIFIAHDPNKNAVIVRLLDFGIAKVLDADGPSPRTRTGVVFGTPDYLSPEQATGDGALDGRSDLFAVGVLLYELITGMRPFRAPTAVATAFKVVHAEAPSLAAAGIHVDPRLEAVVARLLQKDPTRRFPVAPDVLKELDKLCPDPTRRQKALSRVVGPRRGPAPTLDGLPERPVIVIPPAAPPPSPPPVPDNARDPVQTRRVFTDMALLPTQQSPRQPPGMRGDEPRYGTSPGRATEPTRSADTQRPAQRQSVPDLGWAPKSPPAELRSVSAAPESLPTLRAATVRPFPPRFAGKFHVRGPVLRSVDSVITEMYGAQKRDELVAQLPDRYGTDFRNGAINALVAYELEALDAYMEYASATLVRESSRWREIGRLAVDGELQSVMRTVLRPTVDVPSVLKRGVTTWGRLFSFGTWRVGTAVNGRPSLAIGELDAVAQPLRLWVVGMIEQTLRRTVREDVRVVITAGEQDFVAELTCEIS